MGYEEYNLPFDIKYSWTKDGKLQIDFKNNQSFGKTYDTTRLIFTDNIERLNNKNIEECLVSWYGSDDVVLLDRIGRREIGRRTDYTKVLADIDYRKIQTEQQYCIAVMKNLLKPERVQRYLSKGLEDYPERPSGEYIGGVILRDGEYTNAFDPQAGIEAHYKPEMRMKREKYKANKERINREKMARLDERIARDEEEKARLQGEIDDMRSR